MGVHNRTDNSRQEKPSLEQDKAVEPTKSEGKPSNALIVDVVNPSPKPSIELIVAAASSQGKPGIGLIAELASTSTKPRLEQFRLECLEEVG